AAKNYPLHVVVRNIEMIHHADLQSKGIGYGPMKEGDILRELIFKLMH
ncbi:MAG TPA: DNA polymerase III subunit delta, partial [Cytophagales bacterium]|nr:DNA polymerase III subunit delta [Cytophagales bacterium]